MSEASAYVPYCGLAPLPAELWQRWNLDPMLIAVMVGWMAAHAGLLLSRRGSPREYGALLAGWGAIAVGFISPLCALGVALFSARVAQHMWIVLVAAPLLVLARALPPVRSRPLTCAALFGMTLWAWHVPAAYEATFRSHAAYWAMHLSLLATAALLWERICFAGRARWLQRLGAGFVTLVQMGLLGALITLAPKLLYLPHALSARTWGLTALEDQQLGGLIMWIPSCAVLLIAALAVLHGVLTGRAPSRGSSAVLP